MNSNTRRVTTVLIASIVCIIALYYVVQQRIDIQNLATIEKVQGMLTDQENLLKTLAETTRVNGADAVTERIIVDCSEDKRRRFDTLLDILSGDISAQELDELNTLFYQCGSFYADRKAVMATRLIREVEILAQYHTIMSTLTSDQSDATTKIASWEKLAEGELKTAEYFKKLVQLQGDIITELNDGKNATSPEVVAILSEVNSVRGQMLVLKDQIEVHKNEALSL